MAIRRVTVNHTVKGNHGKSVGTASAAAGGIVLGIGALLAPISGAVIGVGALICGLGFLYGKSKGDQITEEEIEDRRISPSPDWDKVTRSILDNPTSQSLSSIHRTNRLSRIQKLLGGDGDVIEEKTDIHIKYRDDWI